MSLVKDERPRRQGRRHGAPAQDVQRPACEPQDFKDILMRVFESYKDIPAAASEPEDTPRDFGQAFATLRKGRIDFDALRVQCDRLEQEVKSVRERSRLDVEALADESAQWQGLAADLGDQLRASQRQLAEALELSSRLQDRLEAERARLEAARQRTRMLEQIAMALHDKILDSFTAPGPPHRPVAAAA